MNAVCKTVRGVLSVATMALALSGCEKAMKDMYSQPKYTPLAASRFWADGRSARPSVACTWCTGQPGLDQARAGLRAAGRGSAGR